MHEIKYFFLKFTIKPMTKMGKDYSAVLQSKNFGADCSGNSSLWITLPLPSPIKTKKLFFLNGQALTVYPLPLLMVRSIVDELFAAFLTQFSIYLGCALIELVPHFFSLSNLSIFCFIDNLFIECREILAGDLKGKYNLVVSW